MDVSEVMICTNTEVNISLTSFSNLLVQEEEIFAYNLININL